jgi:hypothetical protein
MFFNNRFGNVKKVCLSTILLTQSMVLQAAQPEAVTAEAVAAAEPGGQPQQRAYFYPRWPKQQRERVERVPPPPPGPYMSSALTGSSVMGPSFATDKPAIKMESSSVSREVFRPDIAWPSRGNANSPDRWEPDAGYSYVDPQANKQPSSYNYGYRYPYMNWPGSSSNMMPYSRPSAGMDPGRAYYTRP